MALNLANLHRVGGGTQQLFIYNTADAVGDVDASGYFNNATNMLRQFDVIIVVGATGGTATVDKLVVTSATGAATVTASGLEGLLDV